MGELYRGEICDALSEQVKQLLSHEEKERIVLNLENVRRIDATGLGTLVMAYVNARHRGVDLKLVCPPGEVLRVLRVAKLATVFQVFATDAEALASFR
jgi:anti-sigma B factor antagonist